MGEIRNITEEELSEPLTYGTQAFLSEDYAHQEGDRLWAKVWQHAGRVEDIPNVGDFFTYDIGTDSIVIVRVAEDEIKAFHNVCSHRGRQLVDTGNGENGVRGHKNRFVCKYHGWCYGLDGCCTHKQDEQDWNGALTDERTHLNEVKVDTWGGWVWINMDTGCIPLRDYLEPAATLLDPFEFEKMRYKWRKWVVFDCNWKTALEAFMEPYHVSTTHAQLNKYGDFYAWSRAHGLHGNDGYDPKTGSDADVSSATVQRAPKEGDPRLMTRQLQEELMETIGTTTTQTLVDAARRLPEELPEGTPAHEVHRHWFELAKSMDAERGVIWPEIGSDQLAKAGLAWHVFPNMAILQGVTNALCYRTRPHGTDPDKCIYEAFALERFPPGQEPKTKWEYCEPVVDNWGKVLMQDFSNMAAVQRGMKSRGFRGTLPNPYQERKVTNFHRNLAKYMGTGAPRRLK